MGYFHPVLTVTSNVNLATLTSSQGNSACPGDSSSEIWSGITKFALEMHPVVLLAGIKDGCYLPWPSKSFWPFDSEF